MTTCFACILWRWQWVLPQLHTSRGRLVVVLSLSPMTFPRDHLLAEPDQPADCSGARWLAQNGLPTLGGGGMAVTTADTESPTESPHITSSWLLLRWTLKPAGLLYGKINWRVPKADGDFLQRGVVQTFRQQDEKDILLNHGSASLHLAAGNMRKGRNALAKGQQRSTPMVWHTAGYVANCSPSCGN